MSTDKRHVVVNDSLCGHCSIHSQRFHHRDFPEIWSEAGNDDEGARHLSCQLTRARESTCDDWQREAVDRAIADVDAFIAALADAKFITRRPEQCACEPRDAGSVEKLLLAKVTR